MIRKLALGALVAGACTFGLVTSSAVAGTMPPEPPEPAVVFTDGGEIVVSPTSGPPGTVITVTSPGCEGVTAAALFLDEEVLVESASPGDSTTLVVPADAATGEYGVAGGCDIYDEGDVFFASFTVTAGAATPIRGRPVLTG